MMVDNGLSLVAVSRAAGGPLGLHGATYLRNLLPARFAGREIETLTGEDWQSALRRARKVGRLREEYERLRQESDEAAKQGRVLQAELTAARREARIAERLAQSMLASYLDANDDLSPP